ncbi:MAG: esterase/lipase family protein, partial [Ilumatobacteraceae bacterium]
MAAQPERRTAPRAIRLASESRVMLELGATAAVAPWLRRLGAGDGHPVLVLPGFLAGDTSTAPMRNILRSQGYSVHRWHLGRNRGPTADVVAGLVDRLEHLHARHGEPVSVVGWSLGGIYARRLARSRPEMVRQVITMGSPYRPLDDERPAVSAVYDRFRHPLAPSIDDLMPHVDPTPLSVPTTSIYSRTDGVVRWWQCIEPAGDRRENVEVRSSHTGLVVNPAVLVAVGDRLATPPDEWHPLRPPRRLRSGFPPAA